MSRAVAIMAYGTPEDRLRLEAIALLKGTSQSQVLLEFIRKTFEEIYGQQSDVSTLVTTLKKKSP